jgi:putative ABC transport system permease protein
MRLLDIIKIAQNNLIRSKLRTFLTVIAVFIGALTISLTNGVGNGVKAYVNKQLGNVGVENTLIVRTKQENQGFGPNNSVSKYDPDKTTSGQFDIRQLNENDRQKVATIAGVTKLTPMQNIRIDYVTSGTDKYVASVTQFIDGLHLDMSAGKVVDNNSADQITIPQKYVSVLGFSSDQAAIGKGLTLGFKDVQNKLIERTVTIVGVQQNSLLGNQEMNLSLPLAIEIHSLQTKGVASLADRYQAFLANYDSHYTKAQVDELKKHFDKEGYQAQTLEDQIGVISNVINSIQIALNLFGAIALLAASFGIVNTLLMAVNERTREIGLMKALGTSNRTIFTIFSCEAMSLGLWGAALGVLASMGLGQIINHIATQTFLKNFPGFSLLAFPILPSLGVIGLIVLIAFIAGALPSLKASRLDPIEALRYE